MLQALPHKRTAGTAKPYNFDKPSLSALALSRGRCRIQSPGLDSGRGPCSASSACGAPPSPPPFSRPFPRTILSWGTNELQQRTDQKETRPILVDGELRGPDESRQWSSGAPSPRVPRHAWARLECASPAAPGSDVLSCPGSRAVDASLGTYERRSGPSGIGTAVDDRVT
ncbi:hypothetical protein CDD83_5284 [Cordyceps sp. RAO-2017]|nr:hypothetical protein CDD83_5284 [Cordyceps sp. RAO-2017]